MRITQDAELIALRTHAEKSKREHYYKSDGFTYRQCYSPQTDYLNPFVVYVYLDTDCVGVGSGESIEKSFQSLINHMAKNNVSLRKESRELSAKLQKVSDILFPDQDEDSEE